jgi:hypothetical protein
MATVQSFTALVVTQVVHIEVLDSEGLIVGSPLGKLGMILKDLYVNTNLLQLQKGFTYQAVVYIVTKLLMAVSVQFLRS